jgi:hypothetical protein
VRTMTEKGRLGNRRRVAAWRERHKVDRLAWRQMQEAMKKFKISPLVVQRWIEEGTKAEQQGKRGPQWRML